MFGLGRLTHLLFDTFLISMALSGIKRNTGLTVSLRRIPNKDLRNLVRVWLETGEWVSPHECGERQSLRA